MAIPCFQSLSLKTLESTFPPSHTTTNLSGNFEHSFFKISPNSITSQHFHLYLLGLSHSHLIPGLLKQPPNSAPCFCLWPYPRVCSQNSTQYDFYFVQTLSRHFSPSESPVAPTTLRLKAYQTPHGRSSLAHSPPTLPWLAGTQSSCCTDFLLSLPHSLCPHCV